VTSLTIDKCFKYGKREVEKGFLGEAGFVKHNLLLCKRIGMHNTVDVGNALPQFIACMCGGNVGSRGKVVKIVIERNSLASCEEQ